jgi:hypothetical protein
MAFPTTLGDRQAGRNGEARTAGSQLTHLPFQEVWLQRAIRGLDNFARMNEHFKHTRSEKIRWQSGREDSSAMSRSIVVHFL